MRRSYFAADASLANKVAAEGRIESKMDGIMNCLVYELHEDTKSVEVVKVDDFGRAGNYTSLFEQSQGVKNSALLQIVDTSLPGVAATRPNTALALLGRARPAGHPAARIAA